ncbi:hypothetical protein BDR07DRAFT_1372567 [Suillus spraguei]|nr:hypothetical protein BDR07DRAFT_1372567 [Suillus spraguei]
MNQTQIDKFLKLKWLQDNHPIQLIWRDALEVVKQLFSDPVFANHITLQPHIVNVRNQHEYGDYMSANLAWKTQDYLPLGATQVPIILGSDKTPMTRTTRGLETHPIFITISNLDSEISKMIDVWDLNKFQKAAKAVNLSGVHMPYWHDWMYACPSVFLAAQAGGDTSCHFAKGVTHVNQMTGHEHWDIHCMIVASIAGAAPPKFICALHALIDFIYLAQNPVHSADTLLSMMQALSDFHTFKGAIIEARVLEAWLRDWAL